MGVATLLYAIGAHYRLYRQRGKELRRRQMLILCLEELFLRKLQHERRRAFFDLCTKNAFLRIIVLAHKTEDTKQ
jgi:hypothetical protein